MSHVIDFQSTILEMIAKGQPLSETVYRLCREVNRLAPDVICSVVTADADGCLRPLAGPGLPPAFCDLVSGVEIGPTIGACGAALYFGTEVLSQDIAEDPHWEGFRDLILPLGIRACWSSPILGANREPIATFAFYFGEKRGPTQGEREIVDQCVHLCAIALDRERRVEDHNRRAHTDALTDLPNRAAFNAALSGLSCEIPGAWALAVIDLDNLKVTNDAFGHQAGDSLLQLVAECLSRAAAPEPLFRIGGDEFAVIVQDPAALRALDETMAGYLAALARAGGQVDNPIVPRATIGYAELAPGDLLPERVRQKADFALYHAKDTARGAHVPYSDEIGSRITRRLAAVREVDVALREHRIETFYQPIVLIETGEIVGVEALCRMRSGDQLVSASAFHEATSDAGVATALTRQVISQVARDVRGWLDLGIAFQHVGINVSSADFHSGTIYAVLAESFDRENVPLKHVIVEVTEVVCMDDDAGIVRKSMQALRSRGIRLALDDFGTGYASLTHLMTVPVDIIKIDRSFVEDLVSRGPSAAIVEGVIGIARRLGIKVVAEGIENADQARELLALGCLLGQGFHYSRAVPAAEAGAMMLKLAETV
ncbi:GGDEF domain-containing protein [Novosphingobium sp. PhB57]|uniref:putative bifunctional diguanylate cyclase/phosphodiesterase n=1 Tax=Novosphingobium sp. PhB57 TaxID=2485107 RepID=UPI001FB41CC2|nr:GGDEF domain-containing protein [Novosphingobium sp. PhB57]